MKRNSLDIYDEMPPAMRAYISNYGFHFNKKACDFATSLMKKKDTKEKMEAWKKDEVDSLLQRYGVKLQDPILYDHVFVANMAKADFYKSSIPDEQHLALYVKDYLEDPDGTDELPFRRWLATMVGIGEPIEWEDIL